MVEQEDNGAAGRAVSGVRYGAMNWIGEFKHNTNLASSCGARVVIQSDRGIELGQIVPLTAHDCPVRIPREQIKAYVDASGPDFYRLRAGRILREASPQDLLEHERLNAHLHDDIQRCESTAKQFDLDMKVVTAEHLLGGERIVFYFRSEGRVDFRELVRELARYYQTRIEMRQVGGARRSAVDRRLRSLRTGVLLQELPEKAATNHDADGQAAKIHARSVQGFGTLRAAALLPAVRTPGL